MALFDSPISSTSSRSNPFSFPRLQNETRHHTHRLGCFSVLDHDRDISVAPDNAVAEYYMAKMGVRRRQLVIALENGSSAVVQSGAMQWMLGNVDMTTGIKSAGRPLWQDGARRGDGGRRPSSRNIEAMA